jgi:hypothetical protein
MPPLYQFKVTLQGVEPTVWRRFVLPADGTFWDLGAVLTDVMSYLGFYVYVFYFEVGSKATWPDLEGDEMLLDRALKSTLMSERLESLARFEFEYNLDYELRDGWMYIVEFEGEVASESFDGTPGGAGWRGLTRCIAGERACPPDEVVGCAAGYMALMASLRQIDEDAAAGRITEDEREDARSRAIYRVARFAPEGFDPEAAFDPADVEIVVTRGCDELREDEERIAKEAEDKRKAEASRIKRSAAAKASRAARAAREADAARLAEASRDAEAAREGAEVETTI